MNNMYTYKQHPVISHQSWNSNISINANNITVLQKSKINAVEQAHSLLFIRNVSLTFTNGQASFDLESAIGYKTNAFMGVGIFPYNDTPVASVTATDSVASIKVSNSTLTGTYYCSILGLYWI